MPVDVRGLEAELHRSVEGEVRFDDGSRALYATDASNYRQVPIGVVIPRSIDDVLATVRACREYGAPLLSRGGGVLLGGLWLLRGGGGRVAGWLQAVAPTS